MSSVILSYSKQNTTIGDLNGRVTLQQFIRFNDKARNFRIQLIRVSFSSLIPNVFNHGGENNGLISLSRDGGATWTDVQLTDGVYEMKYIEAALNAAVATWWTDPTDYGIKVRYNFATQYAYIELDSTKLAAPGTQLGIDLSQSNAYELLGYDAATCTFTTDGLHAATSYARMNWFGDSVSVRLDGFGPLAIRNGVSSREFANVSLVSQGTTGNEYVYPVGLPSPEISLTSVPQVLSEFSVEFVGSRTFPDGTQKKILVLEGAVELIFQLSWN